MKWLIGLISVITLFGCGKRSPTTQEYYRYIQGSWKTDCIADPSGAYKINSVIFNELKLSLKIDGYYDNQCQTQLYESTTASDYALGSGMDVILARSVQLFYIPSSSVLTLRSQGAVDIFNAESRCGYNDWVINVGKDVSGRTCINNDKPFPENNIRYVNLIKIDNSDLFLGKMNCESDDSCVNYFGQKYPKEWYPDPFHKQ